MNESITIIGAGIGGLTTALALKQRGVETTVCESAPEIRPVGAGIAMGSNAMQVFRKMGLSGKIESAGYRVSLMKITDEQLRVLSAMELAAFEKKYGVFNVAIHRGDLQRILTAEIGKENIMLSRRLTGMEERGEGFRLLFSGHEALDSRVVIGADGIKSVVRQELFGHQEIRDARQVCWRGICEAEPWGKYDHEALESWGKGKRFGFVKINTRQLYWYAVVSRSLVRDDGDLPGMFSDFHRDVRKMIAATPVESIFQSEIADLKPLAQWHKGNACLVGDAAHAATPNLGQGACQAVEDAYTIGQLFEKDRPAGDAFRQYEKARMKKARYIVSQSRLIGNIAHWENGTGVWLRNTLMRSMPGSVNEKPLREMFKIDYI